jgi:hypothetical protein
VKKTYPEEVYLRTRGIVFEHWGMRAHTWGVLVTPGDPPMLEDKQRSEKWHAARGTLQSSARAPYDPLIPWVAKVVNAELKAVARARRMGDEVERQAAAIRSLAFLGRKIQDLTDWFLAERPNIGRMDLEAALDASHEWHRDLQFRIDEKQKKDMRSAGLVVHRFRDGWTMRRLGQDGGHGVGILRPGPVEELILVGRRLQHCYGQRSVAEEYLRLIQHHSHELYVLFTPKGEPKVGLWVDHREALDWPQIEQLRGKQNDPPDEKYFRHLRLFIRKLFGGLREKQLPRQILSLGEALVMLSEAEQIEGLTRYGKGPISEFYYELEGSGGVLEGLSDLIVEAASSTGTIMGTDRYVVDREIEFLSKDGDEAGPGRPTEKIVARVFFDLDEALDQMGDDKLHWTQIEDHDVAIKVDELSELDESAMEELGYEAEEWASSKAYEWSGLENTGSMVPLGPDLARSTMSGYALAADNVLASMPRGRRSAERWAKEVGAMDLNRPWRNTVMAIHDALDNYSNY